ncbi:MAG: glycosyltransferase family 2 protein, partial [Gemmatimonadales bacterium]
MAAILSILLALCIAVLLLPTISDLVSLAWTTIWRPKDRAKADHSSDLRFLILVPAHDEELLIEGTIRSVQQLRWPLSQVDLVVIADNCRDKTATISRTAGAKVLERTDPILRGKPRAIAWALEQTDLSGYDAVVVLDADSRIDPGYCEAIAGTGEVRHRAFQGWIDLSNPTETAITRMASVFSAARCLYMNEIKTRAGLSVPFGNGLCIGAEVLKEHGWTAFSICEDWELYAIMVTVGRPVIGVPGARTYSQEAKSVDQSSSQRSRWAAGKMAVLLAYTRPLFATRKAGWRQKLDAFAELTALGPVVHAAVAIGFAIVAWITKPPVWSLLAALALLSVLRLAVLSLMAIRHGPEPGKALLAFLYLPFYTIWRVGVQLKSFALVRDDKWVR